jgi:hypothetical protein
MRMPCCHSEHVQAKTAIRDVRNGAQHKVGLPSPKGRGWTATALSPVRQPTEPGEGLVAGRGRIRQARPKLLNGS